MDARSLVACLLASGLVAGATASARAADQPEVELGAFSAPFTEPTINGTKTDEKCIEHEHAQDHGPDEHDENHRFDCKPAAGSMAILPNGKILYWNALEGTENIDVPLALSFGDVSINDQGRILDLNSGRPFWRKPAPVDAGAQGKPNPLIPGASSTETYNDGALFCSDLAFLPDGRLLVTGGTAYYNDPGTDASPYGGVTELEGLKSARIYNPRNNTWIQTQDMNFGRWYPTMVSLGDGRVFVASGVQKLVKPLYPDHPEDSGRNVIQTEIFDPKTVSWERTGTTGDHSLPLYPRLHLLPNGHVFYNAAGQVFNPAGYSYDEPTWTMAATFDPEAGDWSDLGIPGAGTMHPGFRGSTFSVMLPLRPDSAGRYTTAEFLSGGGVMGTTPGAYLATPFSAIATVDTTEGIDLTVRETGAMNEPRWYSTGVGLPTGEVLAFSGADRDEVVAPGTGFPTNRAELFDPATEEWRPLAESLQFRSYHNTAALLPDGRVLVGGHAPITTLYGIPFTIPGGFTPNDGRDPSFEIYSPPYLFRGPRPRIVAAPRRIGYGGTIQVRVAGPAADIASVVLVRNPSITHLLDADQRTVELRVLRRSGNTLTVAAPPHGNVVPPGPYMLFVNRNDGSNAASPSADVLSSIPGMSSDQVPAGTSLVPSVSRQVYVR
ncbi:MAG TPA: galactose oxidase-like domain-containing protein [Actinomycetota bacterium]|nr:galactose oxidase-like domain-containing protein [Actinomycetota bacterium]